jgi:hypothetical protein
VPPHTADLNVANFAANPPRTPESQCDSAVNAGTDSPPVWRSQVLMISRSRTCDWIALKSLLLLQDVRPLIVQQFLCELQLGVALLQLVQQQRGEQVIGDRFGLAVFVVDHELRETSATSSAIKPY